MKLIKLHGRQPIEVDTNWVIYNLKQILCGKNDFMAFYIASTLVVGFGSKDVLLQISECEKYPSEVSYLLAQIYLKAKDNKHIYYNKAYSIVYGL